MIFYFQASEKLLAMKSEKSAFDKEMAEVQVQIEAEKKKFEEEENKLTNIQVLRDTIAACRYKYFYFFNY